MSEYDDERGSDLGEDDDLIPDDVLEGGADAGEGDLSALDDEDVPE